MDEDMEDVGKAYADGRRRLSEIVRSLPEGEARAPVPACPGWTVHDVVAHLTGICADVLAGHMEGVATEPWTDAQVQARRQLATAELVEEWEQVAPPVEAMAAGFGVTGRQWVFDFATHEHDVRGAVGRPGARDAASTRIGFGFLLEAMEEHISEHGLPALVIRGGGEERVLGDGLPSASVTADPFELLRGLTGRRSEAQVRALGWEGDPSAYLGYLVETPFTFRPDAEPLTE